MIKGIGIDILEIKRFASLGTEAINHSVSPSHIVKKWNKRKVRGS